MRKCTHLVLFLIAVGPLVNGSEYTIPPLNFEAFIPSDNPGLTYFAFNGRINGFLLELESGELSKEIRRSYNSNDDIRWVYENTKVKLEVGDYIGYWVLVQHNSVVYRLDNQTWHVNKLQKINNIVPSCLMSAPCKSSITVVNGKNTCSNELIFEDNFISNELNTGKWKIEQYIPTNGPSYEFNYYSSDAISVKESKLHITPKPKQKDEEMRGTLDLTNCCTSNNSEECIFTQKGSHYLPPVKSGKIKSNFSFMYGRIEIEAKLPCGDWIFPEISLTPIQTSDQSKIYIAYSRGNLLLRGENNYDIGGKLLFSGYSASSLEPDRSRLLSSIIQAEAFCMNTHNYTIIWKPDELLAYIDGKHFGQSKQNMAGENNIVFAVLVGGNIDFPDDFISTNNHSKPWHNWEVFQTKKFYNAKSMWLPTWNNGNGNILVIDSVRVYAL